MASTSFTNGVTLTDAAWFQDINDGIYKGVGTTGYSTVTSATTPDIFATTVSGRINYTGTTTCTGFVAAPSAGATRQLVCSGAAVFTAGANMLIDGVGSGSNLTCAANDIVNVIAVSTTQFRLSRVPYAGSSVTFTAVGGVTRKLQMSVTTASATGTATADEIMVETALGGTPLLLSSYSQACNLATTGAGGMDTGAAPTNGFVSLYAIAKSDGTKSILACAVATSTGSIYGGANMPAGYTYSALIGIWPTNGSSQFIAGLIIDRKFYYQTYKNIFSATSGPATLTTQSISSGVPTVARTATIQLEHAVASAGTNLGVASDATGTGGKYYSATTTGAAQANGGGMSSSCALLSAIDIPLITSQTVFWVNPDARSCNMYVSEYTF